MSHLSYKLQTKLKPHVTTAKHRTTPYAPTEAKRIDDDGHDHDERS